MLCGIAVGVMQAATPLAFWWLDSATIYPLGLVVIASIYVGVGVCREQRVGKLAGFDGRITVVPGASDDRDVIRRAVAACGAVLVVLVRRGVHGTRRAPPGR
jgi:hypothetical protein